MVVLGIDPGLGFTGFGVVKKEQGKTFLLDCGHLKLPPAKPLPARIGMFHAFVAGKIHEWQITDIALETPFLGKNAQNFLKLGYLRGIVYLLADTHILTLHEFSPRQVKQAVTGYGGASKDQVARVMHQLFPKLKTALRHDVTDALAVTLCGSWHAQPSYRT